MKFMDMGGGTDFSNWPWGGVAAVITGATGLIGASYTAIRRFYRTSEQRESDNLQTLRGIIADLRTESAWQRDRIEELQDTVARQDREILVLRKDIAYCRKYHPNGD